MYYCLISHIIIAAPAIISAPHFLFAPEEVHDGVVGLKKPDLERDSTWVELEPVGLV